ncbi:Hsp20/alpha crystallin family protein [Pedobacter riviphilus]|uniref:Heat-shock protein n=2 Tax=Pedobacter TaxID=84567 RepID=A0A0T5VN54_9SPHI|nr:MULTISPECIES: Hsp20/alpha crystallin family protein [Pedobacter]KRT15287.1 heat-shock protein [Pedobacter ginsenosidimutans]NII82863.1 HSP20 family protein [Pedobacter sp. SG908]NMN36881.1 HSP20 family protein [Pedobacter sp. SG918]QNR86552.1 Hsp20/alpha crystallin family protein [Pedobacter riviphilus]
MTLVNFNNRTRNTAPYFNNVFDSLFSDAVTKNKMVDKSPNVNIYENEAAYVIELAAPGLKKEDFQINLKKDTLSVWAEVKKDETQVAKDFTRKEFDYSSFARSFNLPDSADGDNITAEYKDGILSINISKKDDAKLQHKEIVVS